ncbi:MAG: LysM peptidoglycan-binding domain-containing protein [Aggregatilineales bacterium]
MNRLGAVLVSALILAFAAVFAVLHDASSPDPALLAATQATATTGPTRIPTNTPDPTIIPTQTPLATFTPSRTLLPPPTFEPPTNTAPPSPPPSITPTFTPIFGAVPGLIGLATDTPTGLPGCTPRKDWKLTYTVQANDALIKIAAAYNASVDQLVQGNCLADANKIYVGEVLKVPGTVQPVTPQFVCIPIQGLTPLDYGVNIPGSGQLVFHWYGPLTPRNLIRVFAPDGTKTEYEVDLKQDYSVDLTTLPQAGQYTWYVYPLDLYFRGVCNSGGPWHFSKAPAPTPSPTSALRADPTP